MGEANHRPRSQRGEVLVTKHVGYLDLLRALLAFANQRAAIAETHLVIQRARVDSLLTQWKVQHS